MIYRERLTPPVLWWVLSVLAAGSMALALGFYLGPAWALGAGLATLGVGASLISAAGIVVEVGPGELRVGRAVLETAYVGDISALDPDQCRRRSETQADARAHLVLRSYIATAVELELIDPADPVPYWLVATRRPDALAAALQRARVAPTTPTGDGGPR